MGEGTILLHGLIDGDYGPDRRALRSLLGRVSSRNFTVDSRSSTYMQSVSK